MLTVYGPIIFISWRPLDPSGKETIRTRQIPVAILGIGERERKMGTDQDLSLRWPEPPLSGGEKLTR